MSRYGENKETLLNVLKENKLFRIRTVRKNSFKMNSVTKIGRIALTYMLQAKPIVKENKKYVSNLSFAASPVDLISVEKLSYKQTGKMQFFKIWSMRLGLMTVKIAKDQTLFDAIIEVLLKFEKDDLPSHVIISLKEVESADGFSLETLNHIVYRLTFEQEMEMHNELFPFMEKRWKDSERKCKEWMESNPED